MPAKNKPLTETQLAAYESKRDLAAELLQSVREMQAGKVHVVSLAKPMGKDSSPRSALHSLRSE